MGYVEQPSASYVQDNGGVVPVAVNGVQGVMPVGMSGGSSNQGTQMAVLSGITRVYVGNLSWETEWQDLKDHMRTAGEVRRMSQRSGDARRKSTTWILVCAKF